MWITNKEHEEQRKAAKKAAKHHKSIMQGRKTILIPHPAVPKTWIERVVE